MQLDTRKVLRYYTSCMHFNKLDSEKNNVQPSVIPTDVRAEAQNYYEAFLFIESSKE